MTSLYKIAIHHIKSLVGTSVIMILLLLVAKSPFIGQNNHVAHRYPFRRAKAQMNEVAIIAAVRKGEDICRA